MVHNFVGVEIDVILGAFHDFSVTILSMHTIITNLVYLSRHTAVMQSLSKCWRDRSVYKPTKNLALLGFFTTVKNVDEYIGMAIIIILKLSKSNETSHALSTNAAYIHHY